MLMKLSGQYCILPLKYFLILSLVPVMSFAQDSTGALKKTVYHYPSGTISSEGYLMNGKPEGYWKNYYPWGLIKSEGNRKNLELDGTWKFYNETGDLVKTIDYKEGKKEGWVKSYSDKCYLVREEPMQQDVKHGVETEYYDMPGNIVKQETPYKEGVKDGIAKEYDTVGTVITITDYRHGFIRSREEINRKDELGKQGTWKEFYSNGRVKLDMRYRNDLLNGYYKVYDPDGKLVSADLYIDGILQEENDIQISLEMRRTYHPSGTLEWEGGYDKEGRKQGPHIKLDGKGNQEIVEVYKDDWLAAKGQFNENGQRIGEWEEYHTNGKLKSKGKYREGIKIGDWVHYFPNEKIEQKGKYNKEGQPVGQWVWYYDNGNILREENFRKGLEDGEYIEYDRTGKVIAKGEYLDGRKEGYWFYELGDYREEGNYRDDRKDGIWKHYYGNGQLLFEGSYVDGYEEGRHRYFYENGNIKREENYSVGEPEGIWRSYNPEGELFLTTVYRDGKEYKLDNRKLKD